MPTPTKSIPGLPEGYKPGLEGVVAGLSKISEVNPEQDALTYRGYASHELAEKASFTEVAYLMIYGKLPNSLEYKEFDAKLNSEREIPDVVLDILKRLPKDADAMSALRMGISGLFMFDPDREKSGNEVNLAKAIRLIAKAPTLVAAIHRIKQGLEPIKPDNSLRHGENFLYMATGKKPHDDVARAFDSTMILYIEHGYNASTFAALVTASTLSDMHSAIASAIGALKGPLHGGANAKAIETLLQIGDVSKVEAWLKNALANKEKVMGFGHRVYKKQDSRAPFMKKLAEKTAQRVGDTKVFALSCKLEDLIMKEKKLFPNVDYHGAVFYYLIGLPSDLYTPIFAMSRMVGWTAHVIEQQSDNRLIRPKSLYTGARGLTYTPIEKR